MSRLAPYQLSDRVLLDGLEPGFERRVYGLLTDDRLEHRVNIVSAFRTYAQQLDLYTRWKAGTYDVPSVAKPGTSNHEKGLAVDLGLGWQSPYGWAHVHLVAVDYGLHFPVRGEAWHVETRPGAAPLEDDMTPEESRMLSQLHEAFFGRGQGLDPDTHSFGLAILSTNYTAQNALTVDGRQPFLPGQLTPAAPVDVAALANALAPLLAVKVASGPVELSVLKAALVEALATIRLVPGA